MTARVGILGAGTFGAALARMLTNSGHRVTVWSALPDEIDRLQTTRTHPNLPDAALPEETVYTKEIGEVCADKDLLLLAVPSVYVRSTARAASPYFPDGQIIVDVAKGIEADTLYTMTETIRDELEKDGAHKRVRLVALSGPTHAEEVARDLPTTIVSASADEKAAAFVQDVFMNTCMRVYTNADVKGVELCGAVKNVIAIAAGASDGLGYGDNTKAALITRGMAEITRLGLAMGCRPETFAGLAGIGDLIVTATSRHSRNMRCGYLIGQGKRAAEAAKEVGMVVEGLNALPGVKALAARRQVEMPIVSAVDDVVHGRASAEDAVMRLMLRDKKAETA